AVYAASCRNQHTFTENYQLQLDLTALPGLVAHALTLEGHCKHIGQSLKNCKNAFFIGRGAHFPLALEGALKLKEISYLHAEGFGAGELKHGPISLIEQGVPVFVLAPKNQLLEKTLANMEEVAARGARCIVLGEQQSLQNLPAHIETLQLPEFESPFSPILYAIALQLIAYHAALALGTDVDQPRNLAKSVTVE
ncbi:MAG: SIS domain-containing protein, partial [Cellvibrionaceae bacterium]|nr:SIS domain-containing protein [Cellvibrionaceae bacterium]